MAKITLTPEQRAKYNSLPPEKQKLYLKKVAAAQAAAQTQSTPPAPAATKPAQTKTAAPKPANELEAIKAMFAGRKLNVRDMENEAKSRDDGGLDWLKLAAGDHRIRILPPVRDTGRLATLVVQCWLGEKGTDEGRRAYYSPRCVDPTAYCPVTTAYKAAVNHPDPDIRALATNESTGIRPEKFYVANILLYNANERAWKNEVLYMSPALYKQIAQKQIALIEPDDYDEAGAIPSLGIADPLKNRVLVVKREGTNKTTKWSVSITDKTYTCTLDELNARVDLDDAITPADVSMLEEMVCTHFGINSVGELLNTPKSIKSKTAAPQTAKQQTAKPAANKPKAAARPAPPELDDDDDFVVSDDDEELSLDDDAPIGGADEIDGVADDDPLSFDDDDLT